MNNETIWITDSTPEGDGTVWVSCPDGTVHSMSKAAVRITQYPWCEQQIPEPYVPPKLVRRERWAVYGSDGDYWTSYPTESRATVTARHVNGKVIKFTEVLPTDPKQ